jgi:V/A-type H+-transporting ATPase subunit K
MDFLGQLGFALPLGLGAVGSALGIGAAGRAAAGAWAKEGKAGKPLDFKYLLLIGLPLTQTFYGFLLLFVGLRTAVIDTPAILHQHSATLFSIGLACGLGELFSAWLQGLIGAAGVRCMSEGEGKGLAFIIMAAGIVETVGLLSFVLLWLMIPTA